MNVRTLAILAALLIGSGPRAGAIILIEVLELLTLLEIDGLTFDSYATSERPVTLRITDTEDPSFEGRIEFRGQTEQRSDLNLLAISIDDLRQQIRLEMDTRPLLGPPREGLTILQSRPRPIEPPPVTDRALQPFNDPLLFGFRFIGETRDPETGATRSEYQLEHLYPVPEPSSMVLAAMGWGLIYRRPRK